MPPRPVDDSTGDSTLFEKLREKSKRLVIDEVTYWVVEGDILLNEEQLRHYAQQREARQQAREAARAAQQAGLPLVGIVEPADELVGTVQEDKIVR